MLPELHAFLRDLLYTQGRIDPNDVDVLFEAPTREVIERLTLPAISFFLIDVQENADLRQATTPVRRANGFAERRVPPRRIDLHYMVSAISTEPEDEQRLLWRALATLLRYQKFPEELLPDGLRDLDPPLAARAAQADDDVRALDVWGALSTWPRPSFGYVLTAPLDLEITFQAPLVLTRTARYVRFSGEPQHAETEVHIGGAVRLKDGRPAAGARIRPVGTAGPDVVVGDDGAFRLPGVRPGDIDLRIITPDGAERVVRVTVPSDRYEITLT